MDLPDSSLQSPPSLYKHITTIAAITVKEGWKTRLLPLLFALLVLGVLLASFAGTLAVTEADQIRCAILGSYLRLVGVLVICLFVLSAQVREFNDKGMELILSLPIPRSSYYFGKLFGFAAIGLFIAGVFSATMLFYAAVDQVAIWGVSLFIEFLLIIALSLFSLLTFSQVPAAFTTVLAIYLLSRSINTLILVGQGPIMPQNALLNWFINQALGVIAYLLPGLDRFTEVSWLVYGGGGSAQLGFVLGQGAIYMLFLAAASLIDLYRKNI